MDLAAAEKKFMDDRINQNVAGGSTTANLVTCRDCIYGSCIFTPVLGEPTAPARTLCKLNKKTGDDTPCVRYISIAEAIEALEV